MFSNILFYTAPRATMNTSEMQHSIDEALSTLRFDDDDMAQLEGRLNQLLAETLPILEMFQS